MIFVRWPLNVVMICCHNLRVHDLLLKPLDLKTDVEITTHSAAMIPESAQQSGCSSKPVCCLNQALVAGICLSSYELNPVFIFICRKLMKNLPPAQQEYRGILYLLNRLGDECHGPTGRLADVLASALQVEGWKISVFCRDVAQQDTIISPIARLGALWRLHT